MSRDRKQTLLRRVRRNLRHLVPKRIRSKKPRTFSAEELEDLRQFTGLSDESILEYLHREEGRRISNEFHWLHPANAPEYAWFYRGSRTYLFAANEAWDRAVDLAQPGMRCLDFGGGGGRNALGMAAKGAEVYYVDIGLVNAAFTSFRAKKRGLDLRVIDPLVKVDGEWCVDTAEAVRQVGDFDLIVCDNVLEHVADYHVVVAKLAGALAEGGRILECTPFKREKAYLFKKKEAEWNVHLKPKMPMADAMKACGMQRVADAGHLWERVGAGS